jgi:hypothetical protein
VSHLFALFAHERGPAAVERSIPLAALREWPALWSADPRVLPALDGEVRALLQDPHTHLRYFTATDPEYPNVPLLRIDPDEAPRTRTVPATRIRDKFWQRLVVEEVPSARPEGFAGHWCQPGFAAVNGNRIESHNAPWRVRVAALDCRPVRSELLAAVGPGAVVVVEGTDAGFTAVGTADGVRLESRSPPVAARLNGPGRCTLAQAEWVRFVDALCAHPLPVDLTKCAFDPTADLGAALLAAPGSYILKPRFGSNGVCVVRVTSAADHLTVESDCPDTAAHLEEFPRAPGLRGRDLVTAVTAHRGRFIDRATAGLPERVLDQSILEGEIRQDRAGGALFEPRIVVQRVRVGSGERFATLGALCKQIRTPIGASVARDYGEEPLDAALHRFLQERVPGTTLAHRIDRTRAEMLAAADRLREVVVPLIEGAGARVHQFGIDCRLCWNAGEGCVEYPFLEFQFGIGRITPPALTPALAGYRTRAELVRAFGPEVG